MASVDDQHACVVSNYLAAIDVSSTFIDSERLPRLSWTPDRLRVEDLRIDQKTTTSIWWRRLCRPSYGSLMLADEADLAADETAACIRGLVVESSIPVVDKPQKVAMAESKLVSLRAASKRNLAIPRTLITNDPNEAHAFLNEQRSVAKAMSSGYGLAPFVDEVGPELSDLVASAPVLLQQLVPAESDVRVVSVGDRVFAWRRTRQLQTIDWRREDPAGTGFRFDAELSDRMRVHVTGMCQELGLTTSVQDWLSLENAELVFLEVNPQGQWLFLDGATELVGPCFAAHLAAN